MEGVLFIDIEFLAATIVDEYLIFTKVNHRTVQNIEQKNRVVPYSLTPIHMKNPPPKVDPRTDLPAAYGLSIFISRA